jgi:methyl-accepting chemotaxis protein
MAHKSLLHVLTRGLARERPPATRVDREERLTALEAEVAANLPLFPILAEQLGDTAEQVEASVVAISRSFGDLTERASCAVASARDILAGRDDEADTSVDALVGRSRTTLEQLLARIERSAELALDAVGRMEEIQRAMTMIEKTAIEIARVALGIKIAALNARIEAAHVGERGASFGVVADAVSGHAQQATGLADEIRDTVTGLGASIARTTAELETLASTGAADLEASRSEVESVLGALTTTNARMEAHIEASAENGMALRADISRAVMGMQFQDRVNQRLVHVIEAIRQMHGALRTPVLALSPDRPAWVGDRERDALGALAARYTMGEERASQAKATGTDGPAAVIDAIELF